MRQLVKIINDVILEMNYASYDNYDVEYFCDEWFFIIKKNNIQITKVFGYNFDLNDIVTCEICRDKSLCSEIFLKYNIPSVIHKIFFKNTDLTSIYRYCNDIGYPVVVKQNDGTCGNFVFYSKNKNELEINVKKIFDINKNVCVTKYINIHDEYRFIMLNNKLQLCYKKKRDNVIGNGFSTLGELLKDKDLNIHKYYDMNTILNKDETFYINWQHNLSKGAQPEIVKNIDEEMLKIAKDACKILKLKIGCIDIIIDEKGEKKILEVNSGLMMDNFSQCTKTDFDYYTITKNIYKKVIIESSNNI